MNIVISQPMFFPWVGLFEQIKLADIYVHYDDVQFSKGSFTNRVQVKTPQGISWMTLPLRDFHLGQNINEVKINHQTNWQKKHLALLQESYAHAPYYNDMITIVEKVHQSTSDKLTDIVKRSLIVSCDYFGLSAKTQFLESSDLNIAGKGTQRVVDIVSSLGGKVYITGHGARQYLDHALFESQGIKVEYMHYQKTPYPQQQDDFTPYVSILDLIANVGPAGINYIHSGTVSWEDFI